MARLKIKVIKNLHELKLLHKFVVDRYKKSSYLCPEEAFAMSDTYDLMIETLHSYPSFQIYAELNKKIIGCAVAVNANKSLGRVWLRRIVVDQAIERKGLAKTLLKRLEKNIRKKGFKFIFTEARERANGFFFRSGYTPYLYVSTDDESLIEKIKAEVEGMKIVGESKLPDRYCVKIDTDEEVVSTEMKRLTKIDPKNLKVEYIFEKFLGKN